MQVRESKVRRAGIGGRARLAGELRDMDDEVSSHSVFFMRGHLLQCMPLIAPTMLPERAGTGRLHGRQLLTVSPSYMMSASARPQRSRLCCLSGTSSAGGGPEQGAGSADTTAGAGVHLWLLGGGGPGHWPGHTEPHLSALAAGVCPFPNA